MLATTRLEVDDRPLNVHVLVIFDTFHEFIICRGACNRLQRTIARDTTDDSLSARSL